MKKYFITKEDQALPIQGSYASQSLFLIVSGPSLQSLDLSKLDRPGIITMGVNNSPKAFRPDLWVSVDDPANFMISIWKDPKIKKFVMHGKRNKLLWDNNNWKESGSIVSDCPNVVFYRDNEHFKPTQEYLEEETINWGNHTNRCECGVMRKVGPDGKKEKICRACGGSLFGARSVMLAALKIAFVLGFRKVFIIGADFDMSETKTYAWQQDRSSHSVKSNLSTYQRLNKRFSDIRPTFEKNNFFVYNATPNSGLNSFVKVDYSEAIEIATRDFPEYKNERTYGMYERKAVNKAVEEGLGKITEIELLLKNESNESKINRLNRKLEKEKKKYLTAIESKERFETWKA